MHYCPECGSDEIFEEDEGFRCEDCGALYSVDSTDDDYEEMDVDCEDDDY